MDTVASFSVPQLRERGRGGGGGQREISTETADKKGGADSYNDLSSSHTCSCPLQSTDCNNSTMTDGFF